VRNIRELANPEGRLRVWGKPKRVTKGSRKASDPRQNQFECIKATSQRSVFLRPDKKSSIRENFPYQRKFRPQVGEIHESKGSEREKRNWVKTKGCDTGGVPTGNLMDVGTTGSERPSTCSGLIRKLQPQAP